MYGKGLLEGLKITVGHLFGKTITQKYPEVKPNLPPCTRCFFELIEEKCIACGICANACPNNVIEVQSVRGEDKKRKLTGYKMELGYCLFCGLCVESCPTDALNFTQDFELSCYHRDNTVYYFVEGQTDENSVEDKVKKSEA
ncbi:MAG: NADH-quinone oxidoreductase subunit [Clostridia bacterium]|nr:4Fe-4S ferredoxin [Clostridiales bacterium]MDK2984720.1 NADH-quinone oxidoreductase subunit [Clostridia bacterium]